MEFGPFYDTYSTNPIEGERFSLGVQTSNDFSRKLWLRSFVAYGTLDRRWKYGGFAEWVLRKTPRAAFGSLVHHLAGGEEAVKAFNARSVVSRSWRFGYGETVKHRAEYRAKMEFLLERLLAGDEQGQRIPLWISSSKASAENMRSPRSAQNQ